MLSFRRVPPTPPSHSQRLPARDALGAHHPLVAATCQWHAALDRLLTTLGFSVAGTAFLLATRREVVAAFAAAGVLVAFLLVLAFLAASQELRSHAVAAIAADEDHPGVRELDRARAWLMDSAVKAGLARSLIAYAEGQTTRSARLGSPIVPVGPIDGTADLMRELARMLTDDPRAQPRTVALCACLLSDGFTSPLFRGDTATLDQELRRIRYLMITAGNDDDAPRLVPDSLEARHDQTA